GHGAVAGVDVPEVPGRAGEAALRGFKNLAVGLAGILVDEPVHADHVGERRAGGGGGEEVGLGDGEGGLVPAPGVAVDADVRGVGHAGGDGGLDRVLQADGGR